MSNPLVVSRIAFSHTNDIDPNHHIDSNQIDAAMRVAVTRAIDALDSPAGVYGELQRANMQNCLHSVLATHSNIRMLLKQGEEKPMSVDGLALARISLEHLYNMCLFTESADWVDIYLRDGWKKQYIGFLLQRQETRNLDRFQAYSEEEAPSALDTLANIVGITPEQIATIDQEQLGISIPEGMPESRSPRFPTPTQAIRKLSEGPKRKMLERLYPEYVFLCSFVHGLPPANLFKFMFNSHSGVRQIWSENQLSLTFHKEVAARAYAVSVLSIVQSAAEITVLYPNEIGLIAGATEAWQELSKHFLLGRAIWSLRTRELLRALD